MLHGRDVRRVFKESSFDSRTTLNSTLLNYNLHIHFSEINFHTFSVKREVMFKSDQVFVCLFWRFTTKYFCVTYLVCVLNNVSNVLKLRSVNFLLELHNICIFILLSDALAFQTKQFRRTYLSVFCFFLINYEIDIKDCLHTKKKKIKMQLAYRNTVYL